MTKKILLTILYIVTFLILCPSAAEAANYGLSISPPLLRVHIKPGKAITQVFKLENLGSSDKMLVASLVPFTESDAYGNPILDPKASAPWLSYFSLANSTIRLDQPFAILAGASEQLILSLSVPESAPQKDLYATLTITTYDNTIDNTLQGTSVRATIGANLLITINSKAFPDTILKIEDFNLTEGTIFKIGNLYFADSITPLKISASVKNEGDFAAETKGVLRITTGNDKPVYLDGILPVNVIAKSTRKLSNTTGSAFEFTPALNNFGTHLVTLEINTDNSNTQSTLEVFFFPLKLSLGLLLSLIIITIIVKITSKPSTNTH
jgi:hypothetical protein